MRAELTYALDGRVLGVELPAGGHGRDLTEQTTVVLEPAKVAIAVRVATVCC